MGRGKKIGTAPRLTYVYRGNLAAPATLRSPADSKEASIEIKKLGYGPRDCYKGVCRRNQVRMVQLSVMVTEQL